MVSGLTPGHLVVVLLVVVILFGSARLPKLAHSLGGIRDEFKKGAHGSADQPAG